MNIKKALLTIILILTAALAAADSYKVRIVSADTMTVSDNMVALSGDVVISFDVTSEKQGAEKQRKLSAQSIVISTDAKILEATGGVLLEEGTEDTFSGESLVLNWDTMDVVVFYGNSSSERKSSQDKTVRFYSTGKTIHYDGEENVVFFTDGVIATKEKDPYWSVSAKRIALLESDIFFENATIKIGRVPVLWVPLFFYPGTRLAFNPAIGYSSSRGMFINTTTELYGVNPSIGVTSTSSRKSSFNESNDVSGLKGAGTAVLSFLSSDSGETIRDGLIYREIKEGEELPRLEKWARETGSYFSFLADAYQNAGVAAGYMTKDVLFDKRLTLESQGMVSYTKEPLASNYNKIRYAVDFAGTYKNADTSFTVSLPVYSDPEMRSTYFNRNTVLGLDSVFGAYQYFPTTYTSTSTYSWTAEGSTKFTYGDLITLNINSVKSQVDWKWNPSEGKYKVTAAQVPNLRATLSGTVFDFSGESEKTEIERGYSNELARSFQEEYLSLTEGDEEGERIYGLPSFYGINPYNAPFVNTVETVTREGGQLKSSYTVNGNLKNTYSEEWAQDDLSANLSGTFKLEGSVPGKWLSFVHSLVPEYTYLRDEQGNLTVTTKLPSRFTASLPKIGLTYVLNSNLFSYSEKTGVKTFETMDWSKNWVTAHSVKLTRKLWYFNFSAEQTLRPLELATTPGFSFSYAGFAVSGDIVLYNERESMLEGSKAHLNLGITKNYWNFRLNNTYAFDEGDWDGYSATQSFGIRLFKDRIRLSETSEFENQFEFRKMTVQLNFDESSASMSFKDSTFTKDRLRVILKKTVSPYYRWRNRIGFEGTFSTDFNYDFSNKYSTSLNASMQFNFAVSQFLDMSVSVSSSNNSFYKYFDDNDRFSFSLMWKDFIKSLDFFGEGRSQTSFTLNNVKISIVHYMSAWNLNVDAKASVQTDSNNKQVWVPEISVYVQWNDIPELKVENYYNMNTKEWEK